MKYLSVVLEVKRVESSKDFPCFVNVKTRLLRGRSITKKTEPFLFSVGPIRLRRGVESVVLRSRTTAPGLQTHWGCEFTTLGLGVVLPQSSSRKPSPDPELLQSPTPEYYPRHRNTLLSPSGRVGEGPICKTRSEFVPGVHRKIQGPMKHRENFERGGRRDS